MEQESFESRDLVYVQCNRRICTVIEVRATEPKITIQFGPDAGSVKRVMSCELALVQKYTPPVSSPAIVLD